MILIPISHGELIDKLTILQIKSIKIKNENSHNNILKELRYLNEASDLMLQDPTIQICRDKLYEVNLALWGIEDAIRDKEEKKQFDSEFIELARSVYIKNDLRAKLKKDLNVLLNSVVIEEKSYKKY